MQTLIDKIKELPQVVNVDELTAKDFKAPIDVRWCSGCGDFSVLAQTQKVLAELKIPREDNVFVSGIGCSSRYPYYVETYGLHTMHGRALAIATGLKIARPELTVWVPTGDGDGLSIGGNHFIHASRRNINLNVLMFNNGIYSLTKGQYSPTSMPGQITKSSPLGVLDEPFDPPALALGAGATFVARSFDRDPKNMQQVIKRAAEHKGFAFVEIYTNCVIFNNGAYDYYTKKDVRAEHSVELIHGQPLIFGKEKDKGVRLDGHAPQVVSLTDGKWSVDDLVVHDEHDSTLAFVLANMTYDPALPRPYGVFQALQRPTYEDKVVEQIDHALQSPGAGDLDALMRGKTFWEIS